MRRISFGGLIVVVIAAGALSMSAQGQGQAQRGAGAPPAGGQRGAPGGGPGGGRGGPPPAVQLNTIKMPAGFAIDIWAEDLPGARSMALGSEGTVYVGTFGLLTGQGNIGKVFAVRDTNADGKADAVATIAEKLNQPNGVAFHNGALYVAEMHRIIRYDNIEKQRTSPPAPVVVKDGFMNQGNHQWRYIAFGPDGKLYIALGAPCNVCKADEPYATIARMNPDGSAFEIYARGVRNSVGLAFHPGNGQLWFTDNGRDLMGDNVPADELNHVTAAGQHFGFPACFQGDVVDPEFGKGTMCSEFRDPAVKLGPHVAALGLRFYTGTMFPEEYRGELFIAQHGSWNRRNPLGYRIGLVHIHEGQYASGQRIFAEGFLQGRQAWGRPADLLVLADGSLLVSDDLQGKIYRITYKAP